MSLTFPYVVSRRWICGVLLAAAPAVARAQPRQKIVTLLGDSITAGFGLPAAAALPARLEADLVRAGQRVRVRGAGVSGDTTAQGLARVDFSVRPDTDVCVVALGGNDLLQGRDLKRMRSNLDQIVRKLKARKITVVLAGIKAPQVIGRGYAREFEQVYVDLARQHGVLLVADMLGPVALNRALNQNDGIHPNVQGVKVVAQRLAPVVIRALNGRS